MRQQEGGLVAGCVTHTATCITAFDCELKENIKKCLCVLLYHSKNGWYRK